VSNSIRLSPYSYTHAFTAVAGVDTFYAVTQNYPDTNGSGNIGLYGILTAEVFPPSGPVFADMQHIAKTINLRGSAKAIDSVGFYAVAAGKVLVQFDGSCVSSPGDRIMLAASNNYSWGGNDSSVSVRAIDARNNYCTFSHSRLYNVIAGNHWFYAVGQNVVETAGIGFATIYGSISFKYFPDASVGMNDLSPGKEEVFLYPNPASGMITLNVHEAGSAPFVAEIKDITGRILQTIVQRVNSNHVVVDVSSLSAGVYFICLDGKIKKFIIE